jgi:transcriptional regulator with XRE-family HTH domain
MPTKTAPDDIVVLKRTIASSLREKMRADKVSIAELARQMGTARTAVRRILDTKNTSITLNSIGKAARAAGLRIVIKAEPMSPAELGHLAHRLAKTSDTSETERLKAQITEGFYADASGSA